MILKLLLFMSYKYISMVGFLNIPIEIQNHIHRSCKIFLMANFSFRTTMAWIQTFCCFDLNRFNFLR